MRQMLAIFFLLHGVAEGRKGKGNLLPAAKPQTAFRVANDFPVKFRNSLPSTSGNFDPLFLSSSLRYFLPSVWQTKYCLASLHGRVPVPGICVSRVRRNFTNGLS